MGQLGLPVRELPIGSTAWRASKTALAELVHSAGLAIGCYALASLAAATGRNEFSIPAAQCISFANAAMIGSATTGQISAVLGIMQISYSYCQK